MLPEYTDDISQLNWENIYNKYSSKKVLHQNLNREYPIMENVLEKFINKLEVPSIIEAHEVDYIINGVKQNIL